MKAHPRGSWPPSSPKDAHVTQETIFGQTVHRKVLFKFASQRRIYQGPLFNSAPVGGLRTFENGLVRGHAGAWARLITPAQQAAWSAYAAANPITTEPYGVRTLSAFEMFMFFNLMSWGTPGGANPWESFNNRLTFADPPVSYNPPVINSVTATVHAGSYPAPAGTVVLDCTFTSPSWFLFVVYVRAPYSKVLHRRPSVARMLQIVTAANPFPYDLSNVFGQWFGRWLVGERVSLGLRVWGFGAGADGPSSLVMANTNVIP